MSEEEAPELLIHAGGGGHGGVVEIFGLAIGLLVHGCQGLIFHLMVLRISCLHHDTKCAILKLTSGALALRVVILAELARHPVQLEPIRLFRPASRGLRSLKLDILVIRSLQEI
jgi:hypothetical protein